MDHFISLCILICNIGILPRYIIYVVQCLLQKLSLEKKLRWAEFLLNQKKVLQSSKKVKIEFCVGHTLDCPHISKGTATTAW